MDDDIKEILDKLEIVARKHTIEVCDDGSKIETMPASIVDELRLNNWSAKLLLDYITNLQQKEKQYDNNVKMLNDIIKEQDGKLNDLQQKLEEYKSRCEKAVVYIENTDDFDIEIFNESTGGCLGTDLSKCAKHLLNILNGKE